MTLFEIFTTGTAPLVENKLRSGLSILGIFIGIASVLCMIALGDGAKKLIADDIDKLGGENLFTYSTVFFINKRGRYVPTRERFNMEDVYAIEAECPQVLSVLPTNQPLSRCIKTRSGDTKYSFITGVTDIYAEWMRWEVQTGRFFLASDIDNATHVCVLGHQAAIDLFDTDDPIGQELRVCLERSYASTSTFVRFRIIGVMAPRGRNFMNGYSLDDFICVPLSSALKRLGGHGHIGEMTVFFTPGADVDEVIESTRAVIRKRHRNTDAFAEHWAVKWTLDRMEHFENVMKIGLVGIAGFSLFVGGIGIMNMCLVSVGEKTREIGLRKSVGARRVDIFYQFLTESICLCFCGGALGVAGGWLAAHGMARLAVRIVPVVPDWPVVLSGHWILISVIFSMLMGVGFGVYPAIRAARLSPIDALRTEI